MAIILGSTCIAQAQNWPSWRGPFQTGHSPETGFPTEWSDTENIAWKVQLPGVAASSPIVWGDRVIVTSQIGTGAVRRNAPPLVTAGLNLPGERLIGGLAAVDSDSVTFLVTAFDYSSGRQLWEFQIPSEGELPSAHELHNLASPSPFTDGERVYAWLGTGQIVALDLDGNLVWKRHLGEEYGSFDSQWGHSSSPVVYQENFILLCYHQSSGYLLALDRRTGENRWKIDDPRPTSSYETPLIVERLEGDELVINSGTQLSGHEASTGKLLWTVEGANQFAVPSPIIHNGVIYASRGTRSGPYMAIRPGGTGNIPDSHVLWFVPTGAPYNASLLYYDGLLYLIGEVGILTVVDAELGDRVSQSRIGGLFYASPAVTEGRIYLVSEGGETIIIEPGPTPNVIARNKLEGRFYASPAFARGRVFLRSDDTLFAIGK